jgi:hypothetical protein
MINRRKNPLVLLLFESLLEKKGARATTWRLGPDLPDRFRGAGVEPVESLSENYSHVAEATLS